MAVEESMAEQQQINVSPDQLLTIIGKLSVENIMLREQIVQLSTFSNQVLTPANGVSDPFEKDIVRN